MPKTAKPKKLSKLETSLANALWRTWAMLPGDLACISTDCNDAANADALVEHTHHSSMRALRAAGLSGWKRPRS